MGWRSLSTKGKSSKEGADDQGNGGPAGQDARRYFSSWLSKKQKSSYAGIHEDKKKLSARAPSTPEKTMTSKNPLYEVAESTDLQNLSIVPKSPDRKSETPLPTVDCMEGAEGDADATELYIPLQSLSGSEDDETSWLSPTDTKDKGELEPWKAAGTESTAQAEPQTPRHETATPRDEMATLQSNPLFVEYDGPPIGNSAVDGAACSSPSEQKAIGTHSVEKEVLSYPLLLEALKDRADVVPAVKAPIRKSSSKGSRRAPRESPGGGRCGVKQPESRGHGQKPQLLQPKTSTLSHIHRASGKRQTAHGKGMVQPTWKHSGSYAAQYLGTNRAPEKGSRSRSRIRKKRLPPVPQEARGVVSRPETKETDDTGTGSSAEERRLRKALLDLGLELQVAKERLFSRDLTLLQEIQYQQGLVKEMASRNRCLRNAVSQIPLCANSLDQITSAATLQLSGEDPMPGLCSSMPTRWTDVLSQVPADPTDSIMSNKEADRYQEVLEDAICEMQKNTAVLREYLEQAIADMWARDVDRGCLMQ